LLNNPFQNLFKSKESSEPNSLTVLKHFSFNRPKSWWQSLRKQFALLTLSQWMYLIAIALVVLISENDMQESPEVYWIGAIAGIGLVRELWMVFNRLWEQILGRGLILVLYAATANFALAISALQINSITGIEPSPFVFTLGFATLLMLPFWLLVSSVLFFSVALVASNIWLFISVLLRMIRIKVKIHWEDQSFVFITLILRLILIPYVIVSTIYIAMPYAKQIELFADPIASLNQLKTEQSEEQPVDKTVLLENEDKNIKVTFNNQDFVIPVDEQGQVKWLDKVIAGFIYHFETYPKSACKKAADQRSLPIDENLILLATEDGSEIGYKFTVGPCEGNYEINE
jgi:hypothetical protein